MTEFLETFIIYWQYIFYLSIPVMVVCFLYQTGMFWGWFPMLTWKKIAYLWAGILQLGLTGYIYAWASSRVYHEKFKEARTELGIYLQRPEHLTISINGTIVENNKDSVISDLGDYYLKHYYHHTRPKDSLDIVLSLSNDSIFNVLLMRDSGDPREYWVYFPEHFDEEVGKLLTNTFDNY